jgi:hypothetical protein
MPANMERTADILRDVAVTQEKSASTSATVMEVAEFQGGYTFLHHRGGKYKKSAASLATIKEVLPTPAGTSTHIGPEPGPTTLEGAPSARSTKIITVASPAVYGVGVDVTRSPKNIGPTGPTTDDGAMEVLPTPVGTSIIINSAADDKISTISAAAPSIAAGSSSGVSILANTAAKYTIPSDNLY